MLVGAFNQEKALVSLSCAGAVVLRQLVPGPIIRLLQAAVRDLDTNHTLHCAMAYYNGPPILHRSAVV